MLAALPQQQQQPAHMHAVMRTCSCRQPVDQLRRGVVLEDAFCHDATTRDQGSAGRQHQLRAGVHSTLAAAQRLHVVAARMCTSMQQAVSALPEALRACMCCCDACHRLAQGQDPAPSTPAAALPVPAA